MVVMHFDTRYLGLQGFGTSRLLNLGVTCHAVITLKLNFHIFTITNDRNQNT